LTIPPGIAVAIKPRYGAYLVAAWLAGIVINLLSYSGYYDIALRDFGLMLAALTLARLASNAKLAKPASLRQLCAKRSGAGKLLGVGREVGAWVCGRGVWGGAKLVGGQVSCWDGCGGMGMGW
jgi:hypothetical protein